MLGHMNGAYVGRRPCNDGSEGQQWCIRLAPGFAADSESPLYSIVLRGGEAAAGDLLLSCASTEAATISWLGEATSWFTNEVRGRPYHLASSLCSHSSHRLFQNIIYPYHMAQHAG